MNRNIALYVGLRDCSLILLFSDTDFGLLLLSYLEIEVCIMNLSAVINQT